MIKLYDGGIIMSMKRNRERGSQLKVQKFRTELLQDNDVGGIKKLYILLIEDATFRPRESIIFIKRSGETPPLIFPQTTHNRAGPVLALVAVDENWMVSRVENRFQTFRDHTCWHVNEGLLVALHSHLQQSDVVLGHEGNIGFWVVLWAEKQDRLEFDCLDEFEVLHRNKARSVDPGIDHCKV